MTDWEDVKRLAADFQLTQTAITLQRLSERNCVEIVKKLSQIKLLDVIYTIDGKEYITPDHFSKEIEDELFASGGRISFNELSSNLNVDISHVEFKAKEVARSSGGLINFIGDELINKEYKDQLAIEINERLQKKGFVDIGDLTRVYSLSADFLHQIITSHLGSTINGVQDTHNRLTFFTRNYLEHYKSKITGVLSAITSPIALQQIINKYSFPEKIFYNVIDELLRSGHINGQITSGSSKTFIPNIYLLTQKEWLESFYKHNGYFEYDALQRVGITEPKALKKRLGFNDLILLKTCCVGSTIFVQVEGAIEDCLASESWTNLTDVLPSILDEDDIRMLIEEYCNQNEKKTTQFITLKKTLVVSNAFISNCVESLKDEMQAKAMMDLKDGILFKLFSPNSRETVSQSEPKSSGMSRKEERKRKSGSKTTGFSSQGREVKTKAVKKKYRPSNKNDSDNSDLDEPTDETSSVDISDFIQLLHKKIDPDRENERDVVETIENHLASFVRSKYVEIAKEQFSNSLTNDTVSTKKSQAEIQQTINNFYSNIMIFDKGLKMFEDELSTQLAKYLLRSLCSELVDNLILLILDDHKKPSNMVLPLTIEARQKIINKLDTTYKETFQALNTTLNETSIENFLTKLDETFEKCDMMVKKLDKRKEATIMSELRQNIILQLEDANSTDYPLILHLSTLLLVWLTKKCMIHASGKFVPQLIAALKPLLTDENYQTFHECEKLIVQLIKTEKETPLHLEMEEKLSIVIPQVKAIALNFNDSKK